MHRPFDKEGTPIPLNAKGEPDFEKEAAKNSAAAAAAESAAAQEDLKRAQARVKAAKGGE